MSIMKIIGLCILCSIVGSCAPDYGISIEVKKQLDADLSAYHSAETTLENDSYRVELERWMNSGALVAVLSQELRRMGIAPGRHNPKLHVVCLFREGWGKPVRGRHGEIILTTVKWVNIKLVDIPSQRLVGEVECTRPKLKHLPTDFMRRMFDELTSSREQ